MMGDARLHAADGQRPAGGISLSWQAVLADQQDSASEATAVGDTELTLCLGCNAQTSCRCDDLLDASHVVPSAHGKHRKSSHVLVRLFRQGWERPGVRLGTCASYERSGSGQQVPPLQLHEPHNVLVIKRSPLLWLMLRLGWLLCSRA